eukprot:Opistho-2@55998
MPGKRKGKLSNGGSAAAVIAGTDTEGHEYTSVEDMWKKELEDVSEADRSVSAEGDGVTGVTSYKNARWYTAAAGYWESVPATVQGMLGGFAHISPTDVQGSRSFIARFISGPSATVKTRHALDCGAGIGRVTKEFLLPLFDKVDLVEQNPLFVDAAKHYVESEHVERFMCIGLQEFVPDEGRYDVIWSQWVLGHLTDDDFVAFFKRCRKGLAEGGVICVKENVTRSGFVVDKQDSSVTRSNDLLKELFAKAGLTLLHEEVQQSFPKELFPVKMYALQ